MRKSIYIRRKAVLYKICAVYEEMRGALVHIAEYGAVRGKAEV